MVEATLSPTQILETRASSLRRLTTLFDIAEGAWAFGLFESNTVRRLVVEELCKTLIDASPGVGTLPAGETGRIRVGATRFGNKRSDTRCSLYIRFLSMMRFIRFVQISIYAALRNYGNTGALDHLTRASALLQLCLEKDAHDSHALHEMANVLLSMGDLERKEENFEKAWSLYLSAKEGYEAIQDPTARHGGLASSAECRGQSSRFLSPIHCSLSAGGCR